MQRGEKRRQYVPSSRTTGENGAEQGNSKERTGENQGEVERNRYELVTAGFEVYENGVE